MTESLLTPHVYVDNEKMLIEALNGKIDVDKNKEIFKSGVCLYFAKRGFNKTNLPTEELVVKSFNLTKRAKAAGIFNSFSIDDDGQFFSDSLDEVCLTWAQIIRFCEKYPHKLLAGDDDSANLFLLKCSENFSGYFAVYVFALPDGLYVSSENGNERQYHDLGRTRVFVPENCTLNH